MMMKGMEKVKPGAGSQPALLEKNHPTDESLSTVLYAFSTYILGKGLEFNPGL